MTQTGRAAPRLDVRVLEAALDRQPVGVAILSVPGLVYEYVNDAFQAFAPGKPMLGRPNSDVFPEMGYLAPRVLGEIERTGAVWRQENARNRIRRTPGGPLETVYGTFEVSLLRAEDGSRHVLVTAIESTERVRLDAENARLREEEARRFELSQTLGAVNRVVHSSLDYDEIMQRSLEEATRALGARSGAVFVGLDGESEARYVYGFPRAMLGRRFSADIFPFSRTLQETREPVAIGEHEMDTLMNPAVARLFRVRSLLAIPIVIRGRLSGGIGLVYAKPHDTTPPELDFARAFGASLSLALENAELYRRQERVADMLQESLLTLPEEIGGLEYAHAYRSASEAIRVGGDFYDLFQLEHDAVGVTLGDISGKGLDAAVLTSLVKNAIRTQATEERNSPADIMRVVNRVLFNESSPEIFATVFFGALDCAAGRIGYCNAGHTTGVLLRRDGSLESLPSNSPLVGAFRDSAFDEGQTAFGLGDLLFLYSDGLIEARSGGELFGEERVFDLLGAAAGEASAGLVRRMVDAVNVFTGGELGDDLAILAVKRV